MSESLEPFNTEPLERDGGEGGVGGDNFTPAVSLLTDNGCHVLRVEKQAFCGEKCPLEIIENAQGPAALQTEARKDTHKWMSVCRNSYILYKLISHVRVKMSNNVTLCLFQNIF